MSTPFFRGLSDIVSGIELYFSQRVLNAQGDRQAF